MNNRRSYKVRSPEVWALIRDQYLAGDSAVVLAKRFDVTIANIQRKAGREGWTKRAYAAARAAQDTEPPVEAGVAPPSAAPASNDAFAVAMIEAEAALRAGRGAEAMKLMQAAEHYVELRRRLEADALARSSGSPQDERAKLAELRDLILEEAKKMAEGLLTHGIGPAILSRKIFAWRARRLGPVVAAADFQRGVEGGWGGRYWNPDGTLKDTDPQGWTEDELRGLRI
jgi:hypothetical protein